MTYRGFSSLSIRKSGAVLVVALTALLMTGSLAAQPGPPNDCAPPYWSSTLRCKALGVTGLSDPPQPNATDRPASVADLKEYTRVFLPNRTLRCLDGTRPLLYVAPGVCTTPGGCAQPGGRTAPYGAPMISDNWLISFTGGGSCHARDLDGNGVFEDGRFCTDVYLGEGPEMSSAFDRPMENLQGTALGSSGLMSRNPIANPVFAPYNSVRVEKCSYDRYNGRAEHPNVEGELLGSVFRYTLFNHGQRIAEAAVLELMNGLSYTTWADTNGDLKVDDVPVRLPRLSDARQVLFIGHSGGAHGARHNMDRLAEMVRTFRPVDVRAVVDANFLPSIEGEAAHNGLGGDAYTNQWSGLSSASVGGLFSYVGQTFHRDALIASQLTAWRTALDDSCLNTHSTATRWKCRDRQHVLFNHVSTPMFIREDFLDTNPEHTGGLAGHPIPWALLPPPCTYAVAGVAPLCTARFAALTEHRDRLTSLASTLLGAIGTRSEIARGFDTSLPGGHVPSVYLWMPRCGSHEGAYVNDSFYNTYIEENGVAVSMHGALVNFVNTPRLDRAEWRIDGTVRGRTMTSSCP